VAIYFETSAPKKLLATFKQAIADGHVITWSCDKDGDFTHTRTQWQNRAWLRPAIQTGALALFILEPKSAKISREVYAIYHGRFIESMLAHCDTLFTNARATALPDGGDIVTQSN
jgi:hypothetical protein